ncbi:methionine biosynthesis protein MetW [Emcibacteraceae bacterium]|jgi:methionine biosynthesis protein MetW|nr:methionine biosynthesis protein MetW [Emcibacteraceae bacterium]MDA9554225.1 methionine biosynthesis protein MetW [Emcibacteraceae bacterium]MDA9769757.1 methionine biosynthesis protein MetW [Emcibacteraceae bacterium]MDC1090595.1 methionine biosynthesis protein MetW [Emcibacteraceae bacterium]
MNDFKKNHRASDIRVDLLLIANMISEGAKVLDVGSGDGMLLDYLRRKKQVIGRGIELSPEGVNQSIAKGLSVIQGNAEEEISHFPDDSFDYVILSQTLQAMDRPDIILNELLRVGKRAVVSFPNFGYWRVRLHLMLKGKMPVTKSLDYPWYSTPNIHFCTIRDFVDLCEELDIKIEKGMAVNSSGSKMGVDSLFFSNFLGTQGLYVITK